ncbi:tRNA (adenosine(37)-N6)-threonylcarbamoyltransferase complex ATPase subunit type 1 TsaE [Lutimonas sp.]|uniref:tRNA (adenosine(37)-N6)-threonylcarbamoyltransferase complex ATPase subunit type 1 TsaE n=1 Tax=Lutimonas sp. TaxID=1872403 RepID=UPI003D9B017A
MEKNYTLADLSDVARWLIENANSKVLLFYGAMGSGKTTLIKEISYQLGVEDVTSSPTFSLVNEYHSAKGDLLYHFDFYRINKEEEAYDMGIEEYLDQDAWCFIEWPEKVENLLPLDSVVIQLTINQDNTRTIELSNNV